MGGTGTPTSNIPAGSIPAPQQNQAGGAAGVDVLNQLLSVRGQIDQQLSKVQGGLVPTAGQGPGTSAGLMMNPVQPHQDAPMINKQTVGARSTRDQGVANTIIGAANLVGQYQQKADQEKQRVLAVDLERVLQSQQGIQEAQEALKLDPTNVQAQQTLQKNQGIIDSLLSDPKRRKQIGKALDINFTDPSQNQSPEHGALKQAQASFSQQLSAKIPANMQINPQAIQQAQMLQQRQTSVDKMIQAVAPSVIRAQSAADTEAQRSATQLQVATRKIQADAAKTDEEIQARYKTAMDVAKTHEQGAFARAQYGAQQSFNRMLTGIQLREQLVENRGLSPDKKVAAAQRNLYLAMKLSAQATDEINKTIQLRDHKDSKDASKETIDAYNATINQWKEMSKQSTTLIQKYQQQLGGEGGIVNGQPSDKSTSEPSKSVDAKPATVGQTEDDSSDSDSDLYGTGDNTEQ